jgi:hypothetical protein
VTFDLNRGLAPLANPRSFPFGTWDVEASDWWNLVLIGAFDGERYVHFRSVPDFLDFALQRRYRSFRWFAHFGGRYDLNFVFEYVRKRPGVSVSFVCSGAMVISMTVRKGGNVIRFADSYRLLPAKLADLTERFGVEHRKMDFDFGTEEVVYGRRLIEYNEWDCRGLWEVIRSFYDATGVQSETLASQSLRAWRHDYLDRILWKPPEVVSAVVRHAYHGGRTEVFKRAGRLNCYDVNSMYPFVMLDPLPVHYEGQNTRLDDRYYSFVDATVTSGESYVPTLPLRLEKLYFPMGRFRAIFTSEELVESEARGSRIEKVHRAYHFRAEPVFREYIETVYEEKRTAPEPLRTIAKLRMNSLYGKFGQDPVGKVYVSIDDAPEGTYPIICPDGEPSGFGYYERTNDSAHILPHLSAAICSKARLVLARSLNEDSYYCDTDSVFTRGAMPVGDGLGEWGHVAEGDAHFYQPKLYKFAGKWKAKGLDRSQDIDAYVEGAPNIVTRHLSIKEAMRSGVSALSSVEIEKYLRESRPKRRWTPDTQCIEDTRPWTIGELEGEIGRIMRRRKNKRGRRTPRKVKIG